VADIQANATSHRSDQKILQNFKFARFSAPFRFPLSFAYVQSTIACPATVSLARLFSTSFSTSSSGIGTMKFAKIFGAQFLHPSPMFGDRPTNLSKSFCCCDRLIGVLPGLAAILDLKLRIEPDVDGRMNPVDECVALLSAELHGMAL
jgi:hypothetical protein